MTENKPGLLVQVRQVIRVKHSSLRKSPTFWMVDLVRKSWAFV